jgi:flagellin-like hook-associated protein FlgL
LQEVNAFRSAFGSSENHIKSSLRNVNNTTKNIAAAQSANCNKNSIMGNTAIYAQAHANTLLNNVLQLLN